MGRTGRRLVLPTITATCIGSTMWEARTMDKGETIIGRATAIMLEECSNTTTTQQEYSATTVPPSLGRLNNNTTLVVDLL